MLRIHYLSAMLFEVITNSLFVQKFVQANYKENHWPKLCLTDPLWEESTGDWWILITKGQSWCHNEIPIHKTPIIKIFFERPFLLTCFILTSPWISNYIHHKMWDEITTVEFWEWISNFIPYSTGYVISYPCQWIIFMCANNKDLFMNKA